MNRDLIPHLRDRLVRLTESLVHLKARVREAVATELGRIAGEAVNDVLAAAARGRSDPPPAVRPYRAAAGRWDEDDRPTWDEPGDEAGEPAAVPTCPPARRWPAAVSAGLLVARWLWRRRAGRWPCLTARLAALTGHPVVAAAAGAVAAAADLLPFPTD